MSVHLSLHAGSRSLGGSRACLRPTGAVRGLGMQRRPIGSRPGHLQRVRFSSGAVPSSTGGVPPGGSGPGLRGYGGGGGDEDPAPGKRPLPTAALLLAGKVSPDFLPAGEWWALDCCVREGPALRAWLDSIRLGHGFADSARVCVCVCAAWSTQGLGGAASALASCWIPGRSPVVVHDQHSPALVASLRRRCRGCDSEWSHSGGHAAALPGHVSEPGVGAVDA